MGRRGKVVRGHMAADVRYATRQVHQKSRGPSSSPFFFSTFLEKGLRASRHGSP